MTTVWLLTMVVTMGIPPVQIDNIRSRQECIDMAAILINATQFTRGFTVNCDVRVTKEMEEALDPMLLCEDPAVQACLPSEPYPNKKFLQSAPEGNGGVLTTSDTMPGVILMPRRNSAAPVTSVPDTLQVQPRIQPK
jgi:hypothetical protein